MNQTVASTSGPRPDSPTDGIDGEVEVITSVPRGPPSTAAAGRLSHGIKPDIQNVMATTILDVQFDLKCIALLARIEEYNPKRFDVVIMRIGDPVTTALIFSSGKIIVTGAKFEKEFSRASRKYSKVLHRLGYDKAKFNEFTIQNIVAICGFNFSVCSEALDYSRRLYDPFRESGECRNVEPVRTEVAQ